MVCVRLCVDKMQMVKNAPNKKPLARRETVSVIDVGLMFLVGVDVVGRWTGSSDFTGFLELGVSG
jgi:hypothetical protein